MMLAMQEMNAVSRRSFLQMGAFGAIGLAGAGRLGANPLGLPIGCQTWPVRQTIGKDLPAGFQRSEFLLEKGFLDMVVHRKDMKATVTQVLSLLKA